jgi:hypothetical protein
MKYPEITIKISTPDKAAANPARMKKHDKQNGQPAQTVNVTAPP